MKYTTFPNSDIKVSKICLGTMTWGKQNSEKEGHAQMSYAVDKGVNFFDTAELYPVPAEAGTQGRTSEIIGTWFKKTCKRKDIFLASKIAGSGDYTAHIRREGFSKETIDNAIDGELKRLQTDYIDLFQLHWPERNTNFFGQRDYTHDENEKWNDNIAELLDGLEDAIQSGKIRFAGISNEKAWGTMRYIEEAKNNNKVRISTIQNAYSLLNRTFEGDLAEIAMRENIGLLPYSPLAFGVLSGKYIKEDDKPNSRLNLFKSYDRYSNPQCEKATKRYLKIAESNGMSLAKMSLAFINQQPWVTSNIIGATNLEQLKENIGSIDFELTDEVLNAINEVHNEIPNPGP